VGGGGVVASNVNAAYFLTGAMNSLLRLYLSNQENVLRSGGDKGHNKGFGR
jgi:hypothetical protein